MKNCEDDQVLERNTSFVGYGCYNSAAVEHATRITNTKNRAPRTKRTWDGVFLPVSVSVFGVVLFLRLPWIVGQCGLLLSLTAIVVCYSTSMLTTISLAAISTNGFTGDGGPYMMISRSLGPQVGTTVGLMFVLANLVASAMYLVGGATVVAHNMGWVQLQEWLVTETYTTTVGVASMMLLILLFIAFLSVEKWFRIICLLLALLSVGDSVFFISDPKSAPDARHGFLGISLATWKRNLYPDFSSGQSFATCLAILFPGVTGVMSGVCLSGDLKNSQKAMPRGIAYAWLLSLVTYTLMTFMIAAAFDRDVLKVEFRVLRYASSFYLFVPGEICSTFAAVLTGIVGSTRVLKTIAKDDLLPFRPIRWFAQTSPRVGIFCFCFLVQLLLLLGDTYDIASQFATQAFCANFFALNLSTFISSATSTAGFRPLYSFFNNVTALSGCILCLVLMFYIDALAASLFLLAVFALLFLVDTHLDTSKVYWGDASQPVVFYLVRKWLLRLDERKEHVRHWRPSIIQIVGDPLCSLNLMHVANNLKKGGLFEYAMVLKGDFHTTSRSSRRWKGWAMDFISASGVKAFAMIGFGSTLRLGVQGLLRSGGIGGMRPNTVLLSIDELLQKQHFTAIYKSYNARHHSTIQLESQADLPPLSDARTFDMPMMSKKQEVDYYAVHQYEDTAAEQQQDIIPKSQGHLSRTEASRNMIPNFSINSSDEEVEVPRGHQEIRNLQERLSQKSPWRSEEVPLLCQTVVLPGVVPSITVEEVHHDAPPAIGDRHWGEWLEQTQRGDIDFTCAEEGGNTIGATLRNTGVVFPTIDAMNSEEQDTTVKHKKKNFRASVFEGRQTEGASRAQSLFLSPLIQVTSPKGPEDVDGDFDGPTFKYKSSQRKKGFRWGLFRGGRSEAHEDHEQALIEKLVSQRHLALVNADCIPYIGDIANFDSIEEFVGISQDVASMGFNLVMARNMDQLDKERVMEPSSRRGGKDQKKFIDIWLPAEDDPILFLMAHCLSKTSVWKSHTQLRAVQVVTMKDEYDMAHTNLTQILKQHRISAVAKIVCLEEQMVRRGIRDPEEIEKKFLNPNTRSELLNSIMQGVAKEGDTALIMVRVDPCTSDLRLQEAEAWFARHVALTNFLPPTLLVSGGSLRCRSTDW